MSLKERIFKDLTQAMKAREQERLDALRMLKAKLLELENPPSNKELTDEVVQQAVQTLIKQRKDSAEQFDKGGRPEMAAKELREVGILETYLPPKLSEEDVDAVIMEIIAQTGAAMPADMGKVMGPVMAKLKATGKTVDGALVNKKVRAALGG